MPRKLNAIFSQGGNHAAVPPPFPLDGYLLLSQSNAVGKALDMLGVAWQAIKVDDLRA